MWWLRHLYFSKTLWINGKGALSVTINDSEWEYIYGYAKSISVCNSARAVQFNMLYRMHISPNCGHNFLPNFSPMCLKCKREIGTLTHCLWSCHKLQKHHSNVLSDRIYNGAENGDGPKSVILGLPGRFIPMRKRGLYCILAYSERKNLLLK